MWKLCEMVILSEMVCMCENCVKYWFVWKKCESCVKMLLVCKIYLTKKGKCENCVKVLCFIKICEIYLRKNNQANINLIILQVAQHYPRPVGYSLGLAISICSYYICVKVMWRIIVGIHIYGWEIFIEVIYNMISNLLCQSTGTTRMHF